jgi:hypothetical protein
MIDLGRDIIPSNLWPRKQKKVFGSQLWEAQSVESSQHCNATCALRAPPVLRTRTMTSHTEVTIEGD